MIVLEQSPIHHFGSCIPSYAKETSKNFSFLPNFDRLLERPSMWTAEIRPRYNRDNLRYPSVRILVDRERRFR